MRVWFVAKANEHAIIVMNFLKTWSIHYKAQLNLFNHFKSNDDEGEFSSRAFY